MKNRRDIKNEVAYFKKVIKNMNRKEVGKRIEIEDFEELSSEMEYIAYSVDKYFCDELTDWIELVENTDLHKALKSLNAEEQTLLSYLYFENKTQSEIAKMYGIAQQNINRKLHRIFNKIKKFLLNK